jgi:hypothetical protein
MKLTAFFMLRSYVFWFCFLEYRLDKTNCKFMTFEVVPLLHKMQELYQKPANFHRFKEYISMLIGDSDNDLQTPIGAFNPMAKEHILAKLEELIALEAEKIAQERLSEINQKFTNQNQNEHYKVFLNLSDDLKGGWTNHYTSDYDSKFKIHGLFSRKFCTPIFWTSEHYTKASISQRIAEYVLRTVYWTRKPKPITLKEHVEQEQFVIKHSPLLLTSTDFDWQATKQFFLAHQESDNYNLIFNFFYGNPASQSLGFATFGIKDHMNGFEYVKYI